MVTCKECGLLERRDEDSCCLRFEKEISVEEILEEKECLYFYKIIWENREPLSPRQHLIMQNGELKSKKMRGPV